LNTKYVWLLAAAALAYALWSVNQQPAPAIPAPVAANHGVEESATALFRLERRVALLEERLYALESRPTGDNAATAELLADLDTRVDYLESVDTQGNSAHTRELASAAEHKRSELIYAEGRETEVAITESIQQAFDNDVTPEPALQVELENAQYLFDSQKISDLAFREMDCREHYCRLGFEDHSEDSAAAALAENELFLLLAEKYGNNITIHAGERNGSYRSVYIELETLP
jgi:hypothetical protein